MNIHEHQAKEILKEFEAPVSNGVVIYSKDEIEDKISILKGKQYVLKAQIHAGGRGKAGGVKLIKNLSDDDKIALQEKIEYLMSDKGGGFSKQEAFNRVLPEFRKGRSPEDQARIDTDDTIKSIIASTANSFGVPKIDQVQGEILYDNLQALKSANPEAYNTFVGAKSGSKYVFGSNEYKPETGEIIEDSILTTIPDGFVIYDIEKGKFLKKQGNKVIGLE